VNDLGDEIVFDEKNWCAGLPYTRAAGSFEPAQELNLDGWAVLSREGQDVPHPAAVRDAPAQGFC
jgi:hypothetical protein